MSNYFNGNGTIGFTCDVCGRVLNGCSIVNGMKFCAKCYQETFGKDNQQNEIQQLKQQLTEKEKLLKCYQDEEKLIAKILGDESLTIIGSRVHLENLIVELKNKIRDRDLIIEEKDKEIAHLKDGLNMCKNIKRYDIGEMLTENIKLKQNQTQLAITELEKLRNNILINQKSDDGWTSLEVDLQYLVDMINEQIEKLEGE